MELARLCTTAPKQTEHALDQNQAVAQVKKPRPNGFTDSVGFLLSQE
jgi:hypothetical protein